MLTTQNEDFFMKEGKTIHDRNTIFTSITNKQICLGEPIQRRKQVWNILKVCPK